MSYTRCTCCNKPLKDPLSQQRGYGPTCYVKNEIEGKQLSLFDEGGDVGASIEVPPRP
ncbi:MAG: hypothetical protein GY754_09845 [bacterium]|nr:hypothetical protein [bacterium]